MNVSIEHINALLTRIEALEKRLAALEQVAVVKIPWVQPDLPPQLPPPVWYEYRPVTPAETGWPLPAGPTCVNCPPLTQ